MGLTLLLVAGKPTEGVVTVAAAAPSTTAPTATTTTPNAAPTKAFCDLLRSYMEDLSRLSISLTDPAALRPLLEETLTVAGASVSAATASFAPDLRALRAVVSDLKSAMDGAGYELAKAATDAGLRLMSPEFMASFARLSTLIQGAC